MAWRGRRGSRAHEDAPELSAPTWWSWTELASADLPTGDVTQMVLDGAGLDLSDAVAEVPDGGALRFLLPADGSADDSAAYSRPVRLVLDTDGLRDLRVHADGLAVRPRRVLAVEHDGRGRLEIDLDDGGVLAATADGWTPRLVTLPPGRSPYLHLRPEYLVGWCGPVDVDDLDLPGELKARIEEWVSSWWAGDRAAAREAEAIAAEIRRLWPGAVVTHD